MLISLISYAIQVFLLKLVEKLSNQDNYGLYLYTFRAKEANYANIS